MFSKVAFWIYNKACDFYVKWSGYKREDGDEGPLA